MYGKIVIKILIPDGVYIGISLKHVDVWEPALLEYCLKVLIDVRRTLYSEWGSERVTQPARVAGGIFFIFEIGGICCCWWYWFEDGVNKRVASACAQKPNCQRILQLWYNTSACWQTHLKRGSLLQTLCQWPFLKKDLQYETSIGSLWSYIY